MESCLFMSMYLNTSILREILVMVLNGPFMVKKIVIFSMLLLSGARAFSSETLCGASEEIVFSCPTEGGKIVAVCAKPTEKGGGMISYRFGTPGKIELEITADTSNENQALEFSGSNWVRAYAYSVSFNKDKYTYVVESRWDGCPYPGSTNDEGCSEDSAFEGVVVYKSEKVVSRRRCGTPAIFKEEILKKFHVRQLSAK